MIMLFVLFLVLYRTVCNTGLQKLSLYIGESDTVADGASALSAPYRLM